MNRVVKKNIDDLFSMTSYLIRGSTRQEYTVVDLSLSLFAWRFLSFKVSSQGGVGIPINLLHDPGENFHFDNDIQAANNSTKKDFFIKCLTEWESNNKKLLKGLLLDTGHNIHGLDNKLIDDLYRTYRDFFNHTKFPDWSREDFHLLFSSLESYIIKNFTPSSAHLSFTPQEVVELLVESAGSTKAGNTLYDPYCRSGDLLISAAIRISAQSIAGRSWEPFTWKIAKLKALMLGIDSEGLVLDHTLNESLVEKEHFDIILTNPPFGPVNNRDDKFYVTGEWGKRFVKSNRYETAFICHVLDSLAKNGSAAVIVPSSLLHNRDIDADLRTEIIKQNLLEAVISLPPKLFYQTKASTAIMYFNKDKTTSSILLIDATNMSFKENDRHILSHEDKDKLLNDLKRFRAGEHAPFSNTSIIVTPNEAERHDYDLRFFKYTYTRNPYPSNLSQSSAIWEECIYLQKDLSKVQTQIELLVNKSYKKDA